MKYAKIYTQKIRGENEAKKKQYCIAILSHSVYNIIHLVSRCIMLYTKIKFHLKFYFSTDICIMVLTHLIYNILHLF